jgi:hypothetical protein
MLRINEGSNETHQHCLKKGGGEWGEWKCNGDGELVKYCMHAWNYHNEMKKLLEIEIAMRYHYTLIRMAENTKCLQRCGATRTLISENVK